MPTLDDALNELAKRLGTNGQAVPVPPQPTPQPPAPAPGATPAPIGVRPMPRPFPIVDDADEILKFRERFAAELRYQRAIPPVTDADLATLDEKILTLRDFLRSLPNRPYLLQQIDVAVDQAMKPQTDGSRSLVEDVELEAMIKNALAARATTGERIAGVDDALIGAVSLVLGCFQVGYLVGAGVKKLVS